MSSSTAVVTPSPVLLDQVKDYLGITVTTYDTQIGMIATQWTAILNAQILPEYLADTTLDGIIDGGKLLCIAGQVQNRLGSAASSTGPVGDFTLNDWSEKNGSSTSATVIGARSPLFEQGMAVLQPYLDGSKKLTLSDGALSSNTGYSSEFQLPKFDEDGNVVVLGTMEVF